MTGIELNTFIVGLNGESPIDIVLLSDLVETARLVLEEERDWMVLRKTDASLTVQTSSTWQTAIDLSTITDFSKFYGEQPIRLFDGNNQIQYYIQRPFDRRLEYKDASNTFIYDENSKTLYLNGKVPFSGSLYINYMADSGVIDLESATAVWSEFKAGFVRLIGYYAIGIFKGAVDYDSINKQMLPTNAAALQALKNALINWDNSKQETSLIYNDPTEYYGGGFRNGAINTQDY